MKNRKYTNPLKRGQLTFAEVHHYLTTDNRGYFTFGFSYNAKGYYDIIIFEIGVGLISLPKSHSEYPNKPIGTITFPKNEEPTSLEEAKIFAKAWAEVFWESAKNWQVITNNTAYRQN